MMTHGTTHDFEDGKGAVPAHRHSNPDGSVGGWVAETAYVGPKVSLGPNASVFGDARVSGGAWMYGNCTISEGWAQ